MSWQDIKFYLKFCFYAMVEEAGIDTFDEDKKNGGKANVPISS